VDFQNHNTCLFFLFLALTVRSQDTRFPDMRPITLATLACGLLGSSCQSAEQRCPTTAAAVDTTAGDEPIATEGLRVLTRGNEPFRELRYDVPEGATESFSFDLATAHQTTMAGQPARQAISLPVTMDVDIGPVEYTDGGGLSYEVYVDGLTVDEPPGLDTETYWQMAEAMLPLTLIMGVVEVDPWGQAVSARFDVPESISPRTRTMLGNIRTTLASVPFPREAVGVGARWQVVRTIDHNGVAAKQTVTYSLVELEGNSGRIALTFRQSAVPQEVQTAEPEVDMFLEAYEATGIGTVDFDLTRLTPSSILDVGAITRGWLARGDDRRLASHRIWGSVVLHPADANSEANAETGSLSD
jgi:hypothetical protein